MRALYFFPLTHREKAMWGYSRKMAVFEPGGETLVETSPDGTLILDFQTPAVRK